LNKLNLGCGNRFHDDWVNVDFVSHSPLVKQHNLLKGIPFKDHSFDVVYHSHVLEHFTKNDGKKLIDNCFSVLKNHGIIRIAVPDLESIVKNYLIELQKGWENKTHANPNYDWMLLELFDQTVRNEYGGEIKKILGKTNLENEQFIFNRIGEEARHIRNSFLQNRQSPKKSSLFLSLLHKLFQNNLENWTIGKFRKSGEIHQWMYDKYSLKQLLESVGFTGFKIQSAFTSQIHDWNLYELDSKDGIIFKPDSIFVEAQKII
jgi:predicted SAM-dependent methyltransferase